MLFLGTGAAELYPNPYCNCEFCESLRQSGEAPRKRSSLLLDAHTLVDLGPDALAAAQAAGIAPGPVVIQVAPAARSCLGGQKGIWKAFLAARGYPFVLEEDPALEGRQLRVYPAQTDPEKEDTP